MQLLKKQNQVFMFQSFPYIPLNFFTFLRFEKSYRCMACELILFVVVVFSGKAKESKTRRICVFQMHIGVFLQIWTVAPEKPLQIINIFWASVNPQ